MAEVCGSEHRGFDVTKALHYAAEYLDKFMAIRRRAGFRDWRGAFPQGWR